MEGRVAADNETREEGKEEVRASVRSRTASTPRDKTSKWHHQQVETYQWTIVAESGNDYRIGSQLLL